MEKDDRTLLRLTARLAAALTRLTTATDREALELADQVERHVSAAERREADEWYPNKYPDM